MHGGQGRLGLRGLFHVGGPHGAQVVGGLQAPYPGQLVEVVQLLAAGLGHVEVEGLTLVDQMPYDINLSEYSAEHDLETKYTDFFSQGDSLPGIGGDEKLRQVLFSLEGNEVSELMEVGGKFYLFQVAERAESYIPKMDEVAKEVEDKYISHLAVEKARASAELYLNDLTQGKAWEELAKENKKAIEQTDFFQRRDPVPKIGSDPGLTLDLFKLNGKRRYPERVFQNDKGAFVVRWEGYKGIDNSKFDDEKEKYRFSLMQAKHNHLFESWLESLRNQADIEIISPVSSE